MKHKPHIRIENQNPVRSLPLPDQKLTNAGPEGGLTCDEVSKAAYYIYLNQGSQEGYEIQHWEEAKRQLLEKHNIASTSVIL